jgi:hypothetical protein
MQLPWQKFYGDNSEVFSSPPNFSNTALEKLKLLDQHNQNCFAGINPEKISGMRM